MPRNYELTPRAEQDLKDIWNYTTDHWGDLQAENYLTLLEQRIEFLADNPRAGRERPDIAEGCRYYVEQQHLIFYKIDKPRIIILAVLHGNMDVKRRME